MPRGDNGPRFIHEFELAPTPQQARLLRIRLDLARQLYNAFLGAALARLQRCRRDPRWREAARLKRAGWWRGSAVQSGSRPDGVRGLLLHLRPA